MHLVPRGPGGTGWVELVAVKIADGLLVAGQRLHARYAVQPAAAPADELFVWSEQWRQALAAFVTWADCYSFSRPKTLGAGICTRTDYERCMLVLKKTGVVIAYPKSCHLWAQGWNKRRFLSELRRGELTPPYPVGLPAPIMLHTPRQAAKERQTSNLRNLGTSAVFAKDVEGQKLR